MRGGLVDKAGEVRLKLEGAADRTEMGIVEKHNDNITVKTLILK